jgi:hypothetical protein
MRSLSGLIVVIVLSACGPAANEAVEYKYFLGFRSVDFLKYDNTYQFSDEKQAAGVETAAEYFKVHIDKNTRKFFKIEYMRNRQPAATYLFDLRCRIAEQRESGRTILWTYGQDLKTAEVLKSGAPAGRNVFAYRDGSLVSIRFFSAAGVLVKTISLEPPADGLFFDLQDAAAEAEPEADKAYRMEARDLLELGN